MRQRSRGKSVKWGRDASENEESVIVEIFLAWNNVNQEITALSTNLESNQELIKLIKDI